jgi:hypothetical protein
MWLHELNRHRPRNGRNSESTARALLASRAYREPRTRGVDELAPEIEGEERRGGRAYGVRGCVDRPRRSRVNPGCTARELRFPDSGVTDEDRALPARSDRSSSIPAPVLALVSTKGIRGIDRLRNLAAAFSRISASPSSILFRQSAGAIPAWWAMRR